MIEGLHAFQHEGGHWSRLHVCQQVLHPYSFGFVL